jgi:glycosyltransferase involved in cell wall biosynthesis
VVRTIHNTVFWTFWRRMGRWADRQMSRSFVAGVSPGATEAFNRLRRESGGSAPLQPAVTIYNGVPEPKLLPKSFRKAEAEPIKIVFGGRFEEQKGTDLLPQILAQVRPPGPAGARLVLFGSGAQEPQLQAMAKSPPPGWTVEVRRPIPNFAAHLGEYDLVVMPSRYEGLALVSIEASLSGTPIVATEAPGLKETLPSEHPWFARINDASSFASTLQHALDHTELWSKTGEAARAFAQEQFSVRTMRDAYRVLYRQALASQHR